MADRSRVNAAYLLRHLLGFSLLFWIVIGLGIYLFCIAPGSLDTSLSYAA